MDTPILLDAVGVQLAAGQRALYATAGIHANGRLKPGTVVRKTSWAWVTEGTAEDQRQEQDNGSWHRRERA